MPGIPVHSQRFQCQKVHIRKMQLSESTNLSRWGYLKSLQFFNNSSSYRRELESREWHYFAHNYVPNRIICNTKHNFPNPMFWTDRIWPDLDLRLIYNLTFPKREVHRSTRFNKKNAMVTQFWCCGHVWRSYLPYAKPNIRIIAVPSDVAGGPETLQFDALLVWSRTVWW